MLRIMLDTVCLADEMRVDETIDDKVFIGIHRAPVCNRERMVCNGVGNWAPDINQADSGFEETLGVVA